MWTFIIILALIASHSITFFAGRNNPNLSIVNKAIAAGKLIKDAAGNIVKAVK